MVYEGVFLDFESSRFWCFTFIFYFNDLQGGHFEVFKVGVL